MRKFGFPSITALLGCLALLLLLPLGILGALQLSGTGKRVAVISEVQPLATSLRQQLHLRSAVEAEMFASSWDVGGYGFIGLIPESDLEALDTGFVMTVEQSRQSVDTLAFEYGDADLTAQITRNRQIADASDDSREILASYGSTLQTIEDSLTTTQNELFAVGSRTGDEELTRAAELVAAASDLQVASSNQFVEWAEISTGLSTELLPQDAADFAVTLGRKEERRIELGQLVRSNTELAEQLELIEEQGDGLALRNAYTDTLRTTFQLDPSLLVPMGSGAPEQPADQMADTANSFLSLRGVNQDFDRQLESVVDITLDRLEVHSERVSSEATSARRNTLGLLVIGSLLTALGVVGHAAFVARPLHRVAQVAEQLGRGDLDARVPLSGAREVRVSAQALNEAISSLRLAESQAVALAEERLEDPVLELEAPGELGRSLRVAVQRLTTSLEERDEFQELLSHEASHDGLTRIPNRTATLRHLDAAMARTRRASTSVALLFIDIDRFKAINDVHGHHVGDLVLQELAKRLTSALRSGDLVGRIGGDEFVIVAEPVGDINEAANLAQRVLSVISAPVNLGDKVFYPSASIGVGLDNGDLSPGELLRDADMAVYRAKAKGKDQIALCDESLRSEWREQEKLKTAIGIALAENQFELFFQPSFDSSSRWPVSFEALIRWNHPTAGVRGPDEFIPTAEKTDLIAEIDRWVLDAAAAQVAAWKGNPSFDAASVAVNISARHLGSGTLVEDVSEVVKRHEILPNSLILELTETALMEDLVTAARELAQLRKIGVRIALDDYGTGYMSLAHLRTLPVDILKIDRSFVSELVTKAEQSLVHLIVDTGRLLNLAVTAEGVETVEQRDALLALGVDTLQGYLFAQPRPASQLMDQPMMLPVALAR